MSRSFRGSEGADGWSRGRRLRTALLRWRPSPAPGLWTLVTMRYVAYAADTPARNNIAFLERDRVEGVDAVMLVTMLGLGRAVAGYAAV